MVDPLTSRPPPDEAGGAESFVGESKAVNILWVKNTAEFFLFSYFSFAASGSYRRGTSLTLVRVTLWTTTAFHLDTQNQKPDPTPLMFTIPHGSVVLSTRYNPEGCASIWMPRRGANPLVKR